MNKEEIAILSFKILSITAFLKVIEKLPDSLYFLFRNDFRGFDTLNFITIVVPPLLLAFCGILLWFVAPFLSSSIFKSKMFEHKSNASSVDIQRIAFSIVGVFILASTLPKFVQSAVMYYSGSNYYDSIEGKIPLSAIIAILLLQVVLGLWLFFGSRGLVKFIRSMNGRGACKEERTEDQKAELGT